MSRAPFPWGHRGRASSTPAGHGRPAPRGAEPRTLAVNGVRLVFGLAWLPLLGARPQQEAAQLARQQRASHRVLLGQPPLAVGLLSWRAAPAEPLHAAAHCLAARHPVGSVAACWPLPDGSHWVVAVHEGMVVARSDRCYASAEDAQSMLKELQLAYPRLCALVAPAQAGDLWAALAAQSTPASVLQRVGAGPRRRWLALAGAVIMAAAWLLQRPGMGAPPARAPVVPPEPPAASAGGMEALPASQALSAHRLPGALGLQLALGSLRGLPLRPGGWRLLRAHCAWQAGGWSCEASYRRQDAGADNLGLQAALAGLSAPPALRFDTLETAVLSWTRSWQGVAVADAALASSADNDGRLASALQALQPVFRRLVLGGPGPVLPPAESRALSALGLARRAVVAEGPLRAADQLLPHAEAIAWQRLELVVAPATIVPAARASVFNLTMQGTLYERLAANQSR